MKRTLLLVSTFAMLNFSFGYTQTSGKKSTKSVSQNQQLSVKTDVDTLSYTYGINLANQGMKQYLEQMGLFNDEATKEQNMQTFINALKEGLLATPEEKVRIVGLGIGDQVNKMADGLSQQTKVENLNMQLIAKGIEDILLNNTPLVDNGEAIFQQQMEKVNEKAEELKKQEYASQIEEGNKFMEQNKLQDGVVALPSGLQYKIVQQGTGEIPTATDQVKVHYRGTLLDGTEFDSSYKRGEPIVLGVGQVIKGWTEALQLMPVGSKWMLYIPYDLAYGERGGAGAIPPYSNLIFEVELLGIEK
ncbi:MAG: FKBP-type peptidyl-prolyl cis-trans isomerase [Dysgonomonas sp.]|nr:FKBP-type peptidyl-prolyl cis-trans isomerase [Dysgonomonas sp.]